MPESASAREHSAAESVATGTTTRNTGAATTAIIPAAVSAGDIGPSANDQSHDFRATINVLAGFGDTVAGNPGNPHVCRQSPGCTEPSACDASTG